MAQSSTNGQKEPAGGAERTGGSDGEAAITLGLLDALHENSEVSQRRLSSELGIALGLTNAYLRRCVRKGWIKVKSVPANRYAYYLTPKGFAEKSRLTASYLSRSLSFYREARNECDALLAGCGENGWARIALYGAGDLAEIALLCAMRHPVEIAGVVQPGAAGEHFLDVPLVASVADLEPVDGVLLTEYIRPQSSYEVLVADLAADLAADRILVPGFLKVSRQLPGEPGAEAAQ